MACRSRVSFGLLSSSTALPLGYASPPPFSPCRLHFHFHPPSGCNTQRLGILPFFKQNKSQCSCYSTQSEPSTASLGSLREEREWRRLMTPCDVMSVIVKGCRGMLFLRELVLRLGRAGRPPWSLCWPEPLRTTGLTRRLQLSIQGSQPAGELDIVPGERKA